MYREIFLSLGDIKATDPNNNNITKTNPQKTTHKTSQKAQPPHKHLHNAGDEINAHSEKKKQPCCEGPKVKNNLMHQKQKSDPAADQAPYSAKKVKPDFLVSLSKNLSDLALTDLPFDTYFLHIRLREKDYRTSSDYFRWQCDLKKKHRATLIHWLYEIAEEYHLKRETIYLSINYLDRFFAANYNVNKDKIQLVTVGALWIANKIEELDYIRLSTLVRLCREQYTQSQILEIEVAILEALNYKLLPISANWWLQFYLLSHFMKANDYQCVDFTVTWHDLPRKDFLQMAGILDVCQLDCRFLNFPNSLLAATVFWHYYRHDDRVNLETVTMYNPQEIEPCLTLMEPYRGMEPSGSVHFPTPSKSHLALVCKLLHQERKKLARKSATPRPAVPATLHH